MKAHPDAGNGVSAGATGKRPGASARGRARPARDGLPAPRAVDPAQAAMAVISRCANHALSQQLQHAYAGAARARDYARAAAAMAARDCPDGPARTALLDALATQEACGEQLMNAVLRYGREHAHLAFAFPVFH